MQKLHEFVAAGNNPEHRDAVVVMRQIRQGLARFKVYITPAIEEKKILLSLAKGIQYAIQLYLDGQVQVSKEDLGTYSTHMRNGWIVGENRLFNFSKLDTIDLAEYFQLSDE